jgi:hypothetical protein
MDGKVDAGTFEDMSSVRRWRRLSRAGAGGRYSCWAVQGALTTYPRLSLLDRSRHASAVSLSPHGSADATGGDHPCCHRDYRVGGLHGTTRSSRACWRSWPSGPGWAGRPPGRSRPARTRRSPGLSRRAGAGRPFGTARTSRPAGAAGRSGWPRPSRTGRRARTTRSARPPWPTRPRRTSWPEG